MVLGAKSSASVLIEFVTTGCRVRLGTRLVIGRRRYAPGGNDAFVRLLGERSHSVSTVARTG